MSVNRSDLGPVVSASRSNLVPAFTPLKAPVKLPFGATGLPRFTVSNSQIKTKETAEDLFASFDSVEVKGVEFLSNKVGLLTSFGLNAKDLGDQEHIELVRQTIDSLVGVLESLQNRDPVSLHNRFKRMDAPVGGNHICQAIAVIVAYLIKKFISTEGVPEKDPLKPVMEVAKETITKLREVCQRVENVQIAAKKNEKLVMDKNRKIAQDYHENSVDSKEIREQQAKLGFLKKKEMGVIDFENDFTVLDLKIPRWVAFLAHTVFLNEMHEIKYTPDSSTPRSKPKATSSRPASTSSKDKKVNRKNVEAVKNPSFWNTAFWTLEQIEKYLVGLSQKRANLLDKANKFMQEATNNLDKLSSNGSTAVFEIFAKYSSEDCESITVLLSKLFSKGAETFAKANEFKSEALEKLAKLSTKDNDIELFKKVEVVAKRAEGFLNEAALLDKRIELLNSQKNKLTKHEKSSVEIHGNDNSGSSSNNEIESLPNGVVPPQNDNTNVQFYPHWKAKSVLSGLLAATTDIAKKSLNSFMIEMINAVIKQSTHPHIEDLELLCQQKELTKNGRVLIPFFALTDLFFRLAFERKIPILLKVREPSKTPSHSEKSPDKSTEKEENLFSYMRLFIVENGAYRKYGNYNEYIAQAIKNEEEKRLNVGIVIEAYSNAPLKKRDDGKIVIDDQIIDDMIAEFGGIYGFIMHQAAFHPQYSDKDNLSELIEKNKNLDSLKNKNITFPGQISGVSSQKDKVADAKITDVTFSYSDLCKKVLESGIAVDRRQSQPIKDKTHCTIEHVYCDRLQS